MKHLKSFESITIDSPDNWSGKRVIKIDPQILNLIEDYLVELSDEGYKITICLHSRSIYFFNKERVVEGVKVLIKKDNKRFNDDEVLKIESYIKNITRKLGNEYISLFMNYVNTLSFFIHKSINNSKKMNEDVIISHGIRREFPILGQLEDYLCELSDEGYDIDIQLNSDFLDLDNVGIRRLYHGFQVMIFTKGYFNGEKTTRLSTRILKDAINRNIKEEDLIRDEYLIPILRRIPGLKLYMYDKHNFSMNQKYYKAFFYQ